MSNDKQERIVCAAVELYVIPYENGHASPFTHVFKVVNHEDYKEEELYRYLEILDGPVFGFITNKNRFVDPKEAMGIAIEAEQVQAVRLHALNILKKFREWRELFFGAYPEQCHGRLHRPSDLETRGDIKRYRELQEHPLYRRKYLKPEDLY